jgi:hypothetical protein
LDPGLTRLNLMGRHEGHANDAQRRVADRMPLGGFAQSDVAGRLGLATLAVPSEAGDRDLEVAVHGYGPGGAVLAGHLAERAAVWDGLGRPAAADLELSVYPAGTRPEGEGREGSVIIRRPNSVLVASWPTSAAR